MSAEKMRGYVGTTFNKLACGTYFQFKVGLQEPWYRKYAEGVAILVEGRGANLWFARGVGGGHFWPVHWLPTYVPPEKRELAWWQRKAAHGCTDAFCSLCDIERDPTGKELDRDSMAT